MKRLTSSLLAFALVLGVSGAALAANLVNKDSQKYELEVSCGGGTTHTSIGGNTTQMGGAGKGCTIKIKGGDSIKASGNKDVVIKGGKLSED